MTHIISNDNPKAPSSAALWAVLIFIGLLLATINFVRVSGEAEPAHSEAGPGSHHQSPGHSGSEAGNAHH